MSQAGPLSTSKSPLRVWGSGPHPIRGSFGPFESTSQTASRSVLLFLHSSRQRVPILYSRPPLFSVKTAHSHGGSGPHLTGLTMSPQPKRHLDRLSHFCTDHESRSCQRERQTDRPRYSVCNNSRICARTTAMRPKNLSRKSIAISIAILAILLY